MNISSERVSAKMSTGSDEESIAFDTVLSALEQLPIVSSSSPDNVEEGSTTALSAKHASPTLSQRSYLWSLTSSSLPLQLHSSSGKEFRWPLEEIFSIQDGKFKEGIHYYIDGNIGSGASGDCYKAHTSSNSFIFCVKKCKYKVNELLSLHLAKEGNVEEIVDYYGAKLESGNADICMEYMAGGTLKDHIKQQREKLLEGAWPIIAEEKCFVIVSDILKGLAFLNGKGLVHGDIKDNNILLNEDRTHAKLTDFGSAHDIQEAGGCSDDIWKTGCVLLEMLNGESSPLFGVQSLGAKPEKYFPSEATEKTKKLLKFIFGVDRDRLPSAAEILNFLAAFK